MQLDHLLAILSYLLSIYGISFYIRDTLRGKTKPNRVSWAMWAIAPLIGAGAALVVHADPWTTFRTFLAGFLPLIVFVISFFNTKSYWQLTNFDKLCGIFSFVAILIWLMLDSPLLAIIFAIIADTLASLPTIRKAWTHPETETKITYTASFISFILILPSVPNWSIENTAFIAALFLNNAVMWFAVYRQSILNPLGIR